MQPTVISRPKPILTPRAPEEPARVPKPPSGQRPQVLQTGRAPAQLSLFSRFGAVDVK